MVLGQMIWMSNEASTTVLALVAMVRVPCVYALESLPAITDGIFKGMNTLHGLMPARRRDREHCMGDTAKCPVV
jgi:hypothetical protein